MDGIKLPALREGGFVHVRVQQSRTTFDTVMKAVSVGKRPWDEPRHILKFYPTLTPGRPNFIYAI